MNDDIMTLPYRLVCSRCGILSQHSSELMSVSAGEAHAHDCPGHEVVLMNRAPGPHIGKALMRWGSKEK